MSRRNFLKQAMVALPLTASISWTYDIIKNFKSDQMKKRILQKSDLHFKQAFRGLSGVDMMAHSFPIEPMLVFTEFHMDRPVFGPHPHAGVSVMTYMLPDSQQGFINRDSLGDFSYIEPGGIHVSQAGSGMFHDEFPKETGIDTHGFQIWINHKSIDRWVQPKGMHVNANEVPEQSSDDYKVRIVLGEFEGLNAAIQLVTEITILHVFLNPDKRMVLKADEMTFIYGLKGSAIVEDASLKAQTMVNFKKEGNEVEVVAGANGFEFIFCTAKPINEPIVYGGPFVMTTHEQMQITKDRLAKGEMGSLQPYRE